MKTRPLHRLAARLALALAALLTAAALLAPRIGLAGVWLAMCGELCFRGVLFLIRLLRERWLDRKVFG